MIQNLIPEIKVLLINYGKGCNDKNIEHQVLSWQSFLSNYDDDILKYAIKEIINDQNIKYFPTIALIKAHADRANKILNRQTFKDEKCSICKSTGSITRINIYSNEAETRIVMSLPLTDNLRKQLKEKEVIGYETAYACICKQAYFLNKSRDMKWKTFKEQKQINELEGIFKC
jgi:hypothetical protein